MGEPDILYYNFTIPNTSDRLFIEATRTETRNSPILMNPNDWYLSILRVILPLEVVPIFQFDNNKLSPFIIPNGPRTWANYNKGIYNASYSLTMSYGIFGAVDYKEVNVFIPYYPLDYSTFQSSYNIYEVGILINSINDALLVAYNGLFTPQDLPYNTGPAIPAPPITESFVPYMVYDEKSRLISLIAPKNRFSNDEPEGTRLNIWFNRTLYALMDKFLVYFNGDQFENFKNIRFVISNVFDNNTYGSRTTLASPPSTYNAYIMTQEFDNLFAMRDWSSIIVSSSDLPIVYEQSNAIETNVVNENSGGASFPYVLDIAITNQTVVSSTVVFLANPPRWVSMISGSPLMEINLSLLIKRKNNTISKIMIPPKRSIDIKIAFKRNANVTI